MKIEKTRAVSKAATTKNSARLLGKVILVDCPQLVSTKVVYEGRRRKAEADKSLSLVSSLAQMPMLNRSSEAKTTMNKKRRKMAFISINP